MKIEIKHRWTNEIIHSIEADTLVEAVQMLVKSRAYLRDADLSRADLRGAYLRDADLIDADLRGAYLIDADLRGAYLIDADLSGANLSGANLSGANLRGANLRGAYLIDADLSRANLSGADNAELAIAMTIITPAGALVVYKKCRHDKGEAIVTLRIPEEARRSNASGRKCRFEFADVVDTGGIEVAYSLRDGKTEYRVGQRVTCDLWDENRWNECSGGIHAFLTREEAEAFEL